jgi:iron complex transport system substrate-binding protein
MAGVTAVAGLSMAAAGAGTPLTPSGDGLSRTVTVADFAGKSRTFRQPVERIVLIRSRDIYELALLLGDDLEKKLIAWGPDIKGADMDAYRKFTERFPSLTNLPVIGDVFQDGVSAEAMLKLAPDLVIADTFMIDRGYKCIGNMERAGLPLLFLDFSHDPFKDPQRSVELLGRVLGREQRARDVVEFVNGEIDMVFGRLASITNEPPSVYLEAGSAGPREYGASYGYHHGRLLNSWGTVLHHLRCRNIAADVIPNMGPIHPEYLLKADPDIVVITGAYWPAAEGSARAGYFADPTDARRRLEAFTERPGWGTLRAVRNRRVFSVFHGSCMHTFGFAAFEQMAKWFYPERFRDLNPEERLRAYHEKFMPVSLSGVWTIGLENTP